MCRSEQECIRLFWSIGRVILVLALISGILVMSSGNWVFLNGVNRFRGIYMHPVAFANVLVLFLIIWTGHTFSQKGISRILHYCIYLFVLVQIVLTNSRSPIFALIGVVLYMATATYYLRPRTRESVLLRSTFISFSIPLVPIFIIQLGSTIIRFIVRGQSETFFELTGRLLMWKVAW